MYGAGRRRERRGATCPQPGHAADGDASPGSNAGNTQVTRPSGEAGRRAGGQAGGQAGGPGRPAPHGHHVRRVPGGGRHIAVAVGPDTDRADSLAEVAGRTRWPTGRRGSHLALDDPALDLGEAFGQDVQLLLGEGIDHQFADQADVTGCRAAHQLHAERSDGGDHSAVIGGAGSATDQALLLT